MEGNDPDPGAVILSVVTGALEPKCFLTSRTNSATARPKIELIHSMGTYVVALGQADDLHGLTFASVGEQVGDQLPSTFLEPQDGGALLAFELVNVEVPEEAALTAHYAQANAPLLMPHNTDGVDTDLMDVCMIPLMWAPYFIGGGTPKETFDKIESLVAAVPAADRDAYEFIQQWGRYSCVAAGNLGAEINQPGSAVMWRDFPRGTEYNAFSWPIISRPEDLPRREKDHRHPLEYHQWRRLEWWRSSRDQGAINLYTCNFGRVEQIRGKLQVLERVDLDDFESRITTMPLVEGFLHADPYVIRVDGLERPDQALFLSNAWFMR
jgi:hypothetical protein